MKKAKKLSNKLLAALLSMAMILTTVLPSTTVYAAEPAIEAETVGSEDTASDNEVPDGIGTENGTTDETGSGEEGPGETTPGDEETLPGDEETLPGDGETNEPGSGDEGSGETTPGDGENEEPGLGEDGSDENDADAEGSDENVDGEKAELEGMIEDYVLDADEVLSDVTVSSEALTAGGWTESIYAEIADSTLQPSAVTSVKYTAVPVNGVTKGKNGELDAKGREYLVRKIGNVIRIDIPGVKAGTYNLEIKAGSSTLTASNIEVSAYDRAGFAHYNYTRGVGAYNDDGTLKDNAEVLYVTNNNKNDVELTVGNITVKGIGNILNSVGAEYNGTGHTKPTGKKNDKYGIPNSNQEIIKKLTESGKPLVVRFIGTVSESGLGQRGQFDTSKAGEIKGLTAYASYDYGGSADDNGHMARIKSGKDITLEGIGYDATIDGWGFHFMAESSTSALNQGYGTSFEVRNLTFINTPEDAVGMEGVQQGNEDGSLTASVERCWVHNNEFYCPSIVKPTETDKAQGDGSVDFKRGQYFTCSYNYFEACHKTNLVGSSDDSLQYNLTYHHNYWNLCQARGPLTRRANVHMYNNLIMTQTDYSMNTRADAYIFSESNLFYASKSPHAVESGAIKSYHDSIASCIWSKGSAATVVTNKDAKVPNNCKYISKSIDYSWFDTNKDQSYIPKDSTDTNGHQNYVDSLKEDFTELRKVIASQTGVQDRNPKLPAEVPASEYSVIALNQATVNAITPPLNDFSVKKSKNPYAFKVEGAFNLSVTYSSSIVGILVNEAGENLLEGNGELQNLPAGTYMIQPGAADPGKSTLNAPPVYKETTIESLTITAADPNAHYHNWKLVSERSTDPTCEGQGTYVYRCEGDENTTACDAPNKEKTEPVPALGHSYGSWIVDTPATETTTGSRHRDCIRPGCDPSLEKHTQTEDIPIGQGSGSSGGSSGGNPAAGLYVLHFTGQKENDEGDIFEVSGNYASNKSSATVDGYTYTDSLKMESATSVSFKCNEGATLFMAFGETGKLVNVDGKAYTTDNNATITIDNLSGGTHEITKNSTNTFLYYVRVQNVASNEVYYNITLDYNDDNTPDPVYLENVVENTVYDSEQSLAALASFTRKGYILEGFYSNPSCTNKISFPYKVTGDATLYAKWEEDDVITYKLMFDSNGGPAVATAEMPAGKVYYITQRPGARSGYAFAGWFTAAQGGNLVDKIENPTEDVTVYAHWNKLSEEKLSLDCSKDFDDQNIGTLDESTDGKATVSRDITKDEPINGFIIHAGSGSVTSGDSTIKYYMTVKYSDKDKKDSRRLYTNGTRQSDLSLPGNNKGLLRTIEFETDGAGTLVVVVASSGKYEAEKPCALVLAKQEQDGSEVEVGRTALTDGIVLGTEEFDINGAGKYLLYADGGKGVAYSSIKFTQQLYTIVYDTGYGTATGLDTTQKKAGETVTLPNCNAYPGCTFLGWSVKGGAPFKGSYVVKADDAVDGVITITAKYDGTPTGGSGGNGGNGGGNGDEGDPDPDTESGLAIVGLEETYEYTGAKIIPNIGVIDYNIGDEGTLLAPGIDYTVKYTNNVKSSTDPKNKDKKASVIVTGKGNYAGKAPKPAYFTIVENNELTEGLLDLKGAKIDKITQVDYNGKPQYPDIKLTLKKQSAVTYTYNDDLGYYVKSGATEGAPERLQANVTLSNNINKGTATILLTGLKGSNGKATTVKKTFKIAALDISGKATITSTSGKYAVKGATPESLDVKVTIEGSEVTLRKGIDYTVKYSANKKVGKGKVVITGKGNYTKKKDAQFDIGKLDLNDCKITGVVAYADLKTNKIKATVLDGQNNALKASQYTLKVYKDSVCTQAYTDAKLKAATSDEDVIYVQAEARDTNNLTGKTNAIPVKVGKNIAKAKISIVKVGKKTKTFDYTGSEIELGAGDLTVTIKEGKTTKTLYMDTVEGEGGHKASFEIVGYMNNINKGTATAIIQGIDEYSGTKTVKFKIVGKAMNIDIDKNPTWDTVTNAFKNFMNGLFN
ncbi:MAG: InlB B-repeat-containing protein [Lachnospiraceae bacterium]|nr:InlB B-repeat-containing protein [Lachnospiraceae bacterium]